MTFKIISLILSTLTWWDESLEYITDYRLPWWQVLLERESPAGLREASYCVVRGPYGGGLWAASRTDSSPQLTANEKTGLQSYSHEELNSTWTWKRTQSSRKDSRLMPWFHFSITNHNEPPSTHMQVFLKGLSPKVDFVNKYHSKLPSRAVAIYTPTMTTVFENAQSPAPLPVLVMNVSEITNELEQLFVYLLATWFSSSAKRLCIFCPLFCWIIYSFFVIHRNSW